MLAKKAKSFENKQHTPEWLQFLESALRLLDLSPDAVVLCDTNGNLVFVNKRVESWFGYEKGELKNQPLEILMPARYREIHKKHRARYAENPVPRPMGAKLELVALRKDGSEFPVDISIAPVALEQRSLFIAVIRDISERKKTLLERDEAIRNREEVLAMVAHDLRSPLTNILLNTQVMMAMVSKCEVPLELQSGLEKIQAAVEHMSRLVQDILTMRKMETQTFIVEHDRLALKELLSWITQLMRPIAARKSILLETEIWLQGDPEILGDRERIFQVFSNLIDNAIKFTEPGGMISIQARRSDDFVWFSVSDTGRGIPANEIPHLFDRHWQAKRTGRAGTGLGLAIAKGIVEAHHGNIWVESREDVGTTFYFQIPLAL